MWAVLLLCLFGLGPALTLAMGGVRGGDGGTDATFLLSASAPSGIFAMALILVVAGGVGVAASRLLGINAGLGAFAMTLIAPAMRLGELVPILRWAESPGAFRVMAIEGVILAIAAAFAALLIERVSRSSHELQKADAPKLLSMDSAIAMGVALAAGALAAWVIAREPTKGQSIFAGVAAGIGGGAAGRIVAIRAPLAALALGVMLVGVLGPVLGMVLAGSDALRAAYEMRLPALSHPIPLDWLAGSMLGLPLGLSWAASVIEKRSGAPRAGESRAAA